MEGFAWGCIVLWAVCLSFWLPISIIIILGGITGLIKNWQCKGTTWVLSIVIIGVGCFMLIISVRERYFPEPIPTSKPIYMLEDKAIEPYVQAINRSDRLSHGFSAIPEEAKIEIIDYKESTDAYITIDPVSGWGYRTSWHIYFERIGDIYKWVGESEVYAGPNQNENIYIHYFTDAISPGYYYGTSEQMPQNVLVIDYRGENNRLLKPSLGLSDIQPILTEWKEYWNTYESD